MSLARAFTVRRKEEAPTNLHIGRAASQRGGRPVHRAQISGPVALISTTNSLSYDAPDIPGAVPRIQTHRNVSDGSATSRSSSEDSDVPSLGHDSNTDASSVEGSPITPEPEPNHLSCYFKPTVDTKTPNRSPSTSTRSSWDAPDIPRRVPSHSKRAHEFVHRKRSVQRLMSPPASLVRRNSNEMFNGYSTPPVEAPTENPFGNELAQLDEVAEEISHAVRDAAADEDMHVMEVHGLAQFSASDYLSEIQSLIYETFTPEQPCWI